MTQADPLPPTASPHSVTRGYAFGPFRLDLPAYQLLKDGTPVELTSRVFDTLVFLLTQRHRVVTKEELLAAVWRDAVVTDDSLVQCISALRRALGDDASKPTYVTTLARRGYRFAAPATEWAEPVESVHAGTAPAGVSVTPFPSLREDAPTRGARPRALGRVLAWLAPVAALLLGLGWWLGTATAGRTASGSVAVGTLRFSQQAPPTTTFASGGALSPDSVHLAFAAEDMDTGRTHLWVRALDSDTPRQLAGTDGASRPFWSPDSRFIGFVSNGRLKTVSVSGGAPTDLAPVGPRSAGAAWSPRGQILFSTWLAGFSSVSASGGTVTLVTELASNEIAHAWPQFLPDGDHFLYSVYGRDGNGVYVGRLSTGERTHLVAADPGAIYSPLGYLVFSRNSVLTAQRFNPSALALTGDPFTIVAGSVEFPSMTNGTMLSAAAGMLAIGGAQGRSELVWFDRTGRRIGALPAPVPLHNPVFSADEKRVFGNTFPPAQSGVWMVDLERGATSRLVTNATMPVPAPDGKTLAFTATRDEGSGIFTLRLDGSSGDDDAFAVSADRKTPVQFTSDGQSVLYYASTTRGQDLFRLPLAGGGAPQPLLSSAANEIQGRLSPDGRWLAYASDESGKWEVYVQSFPDAKSRLTVSTSGGAEPVWRADGRELYYMSEDRALMAVDVTPGQGQGQSLGLTRSKPLFRPRVIGEPSTYRSHYAVTSDGQRFLVDVLRDPGLDPVTVLLNWANPTP